MKKSNVERNSRKVVQNKIQWTISLSASLKTSRIPKHNGEHYQIQHRDKAK